MNPKVDEYLNKAKKWTDEMAALRTLALDCGLTEDFKWNQPCYTLNNANVVMIGSFKDACVLSFIKGTLLKDLNKILGQPGSETQSWRWLKCTSVEGIKAIESTIKDYIYEAIEIEKAGLKVVLQNITAFTIPDELKAKFDVNSTFKNAFYGLTPGRQRAYAMFFSAAKQSKSREARIEKFIPRILDGKGMNDCTCGMSKKMPQCDGSHKYIA
jgi:uncharacterized protein YdeI (YjbR/CyaY-like superfamily)